MRSSSELDASASLAAALRGFDLFLLLDFLLLGFLCMCPGVPRLRGTEDALELSFRWFECEVAFVARLLVADLVSRLIAVGAVGISRRESAFSISSAMICLILAGG